MALTEIGELSRKFDSLATQLGIANTHLHIYINLRDAQKGELQNEFYKARDFWDYTLRGHVQAAILHLCRVYDDFKYDKTKEKKNAFHLLRFIEELKEMFGNNLSSSEKELFEIDFKYLQKEHEKENILPDRKVLKLRHLRHNIFAHQNLRWVLEDREELLKEYGLELNEIQELVTMGFSILKRWTRYYKPSYKNSLSQAGFPITDYPINELVSGKNDYSYVLEALHSQARRSKRDNTLPA